MCVVVCACVCARIYHLYIYIYYIRPCKCVYGICVCNLITTKLELKNAMTPTGDFTVIRRCWLNWLNSFFKRIMQQNIQKTCCWWLWAAPACHCRCMEGRRKTWIAIHRNHVPSMTLDALGRCWLSARSCNRHYLQGSANRASEWLRYWNSQRCSCQLRGWRWRSYHCRGRGRFFASLFGRSRWQLGLHKLRVQHAWLLAELVLRKLHGKLWKRQFQMATASQFSIAMLPPQPWS